MSCSQERDYRNPAAEKEEVLGYSWAQYKKAHADGMMLATNTRFQHEGLYVATQK